MAALVLALVGTLVLVRYVQGARERAESGGRLVPVLVLTEPVPKSTGVERLREVVRLARVPAPVRARDALTTLDQQEGKVTALDLVAGEQVLSTRLVTPEVLERAEIPKDRLRVTVALDPERAVGGLVRAGDTVAVLASFDPFGVRGEDGNDTANTTHLILHKVPVAAVQLLRPQAKAEEKPEDPRAPTMGPAGKLLVTLAVDASATERVVFAAEHGRIWLVAEPAAASEAGTKVVTPLNEFQ